MRGQRHAPAAPYPRERPGTYCTGGWVGLRNGPDWCGKSRPTGIRSPDHPARRQSLYRLRYQAHTVAITICNFQFKRTFYTFQSVHRIMMNKICIHHYFLSLSARITKTDKKSVCRLKKPACTQCHSVERVGFSDNCSLFLCTTSMAKKTELPRQLCTESNRQHNDTVLSHIM